MSLIIEQALNGVIIRTRYKDESDGIAVFETEDNMGNENYEGRAAVLWHLIDQLGWYGSKHDDKRLRIHIETNEETSSAV